MNLHEFQSKELFSKVGIPILNGKVASSVQQAKEAAQKLQGNQWVIKAQIHAGGRGKAGGIHIANSLDEVEGIASKLLGSRLVTKQTDPSGLPVNLVYIETATDINHELYLSLLIDRNKESWTFIASSEGGMDIEIVAEQHPENIMNYTINPVSGIDETQLESMFNKLLLNKELKEQFISITEAIFKLSQTIDASLIEINPLIVDQNNNLVALDAKIVVEDNALFRQPELKGLRDDSQEDIFEKRASENDLSYVSLGGDIACLVNGAGLAMATMDLIKIHGGQPANFLDVGGGATAERVTAAFELILENPNVKAILVNIFGGIVRCDVIAEGIINAIKKTHLSLPIIVRLEGTNVKSGKLKLMESGLDIIAANDLTDAAEKVVRSALNYKELK
ncbi:MAG TPA: ADP-forming succinate--CoA ligase subunit beta [Gammaproteobacteria bacterium]|jgi:succinyl-CoA synthetase beta subunit|nr:ADP-forming succinate--CoA ligase subunit beta [Gammaproteobacteria bacterium]HJP43231.1 ADP-forming succinate--CoA ligase subunit beta [Gammaproteobacteria bacterium]